MIFTKKSTISHYRSVAELIGVQEMFDRYALIQADYNTARSIRVRDMVTHGEGIPINGDDILIAENWV